ncbi:uncharacterized protein with HEPN domain [Rhizobium sp. PP-F2F-G48]|uniref:HepT-like ribonuclease domain-containing protein n=1 Tax=Rhizobium sp. PP-F2F-G48 TaxID=2135651 RepID=UPI001045F77D|nr:HepT-like ribonuclease domain-containing protein [Rhizobium sp. PP-F2F-G48]TCM55792.1 uncharacterized protein with HEPN domain [Rhizobium sp. PP-F2F-G48]
MRAFSAVGHLLAMQEAGLQALECCIGIDHAAFLADKKTHQAVLFNLMIVGESSSRILKSSPSFTSRFPDIPWRNMMGMRNRIAHAHTTLNLATIWATLEQSIPTLIETLPTLLDAARQEEAKG